jgi:hypothetical protein
LILFRVLIQPALEVKDQSTKIKDRWFQSRQVGIETSYKFSGDFVDRVTPVPIPNTEVKPVGADGTARVTVWESRKSPGLFKKSPLD